jgi:hypothetical protein
MFTIESHSTVKDIVSYLEKFSKDVRYSGTTKELKKTQKGVRRIPVGIIRGCKYFGSLAGVNMRFNTSRYKMDTITNCKGDRRHHEISVD